MLTIEAYAAVRTAELEGFRLEEALDLEGVTAEQWQGEAAHWDELLTDPAFPDSPLGPAFDAALAHAAERYGRAIEPLDTDLSAWVGFHRWLLAHPRPDAALRRVGLEQRDVARLVRTWSERARADAAIATEQLALQAAAAKSPPAAPPPVVTRPRAPAPRSAGAVPREALDLEQARDLLATARARVGAAAKPSRAEFPEPAVRGLASARDESDGDEPDDDASPTMPNRPPPLVVPLPRLEDMAGALRPTEAAEASRVPPEVVPARDAPAEAQRAPSEVPRLRSNIPTAPSDIPRAPSDLPRPPSDLPRPPSDIPRAPCDLPRAPSDLPRAPSDIPHAPIIAPAPPLPAVNLNSTLPDSFVLADMPWSKKKLDALPFQVKAVPHGLPFVARKSEPPPPAATVPSAWLSALPSSGTIMAMPAADPARATPFQSTESSGGTGSARPATPFDHPAKTAGSGEPSGPTPAQAGPKPTTEAPAGAAPTGAPTAPTLTVGQFALLLEDLTAAEKAADPVTARRATLASAGLTETSFDELARSWRKRAEAEPALFAELARAREGYRRWRAGSR